MVKTEIFNRIAAVSLFILGILLISPISLAVGEDFKPYPALEKVNACSCNLITNDLFIQNTGDVESTYVITNTGDASLWSSYSEAQFKLAPNERQMVEQYLNIPCSARGEYTIKTSVRTFFGLEKEFEQKLEVNNCPNIYITQESIPPPTCSCRPMQYEFGIINTGNQPDLFEIDVSPFEQYVSFSENAILLDAGEKKIITVFMTLPCDAYGDHLFTLQVKAKNTGILASKYFVVSTNNCFLHNLEVLDQQNVCMDMTSNIPIKITNQGHAVDTYSVTIDGSKFAKLDKKEVKLQSGYKQQDDSYADDPHHQVAFLFTVFFLE